MSRVGSRRGRGRVGRCVAVGVTWGAVLAATAAATSAPPNPAAEAATPVGTAAPADTAGAASIHAVQIWTRTTVGPIDLSSPIPDTIRGTPAIVVGTVGGRVYAVGLAHGGSINGWPVLTPGTLPVDASPSVDGATVYVGVGDVGHPAGGGYLAINSNGTRRWFRQISAEPHGTKQSGVQASMAVGQLDGASSVVAGSLGQQMDELRSSTGAVRPGFPWVSSDSEFSTPAIANVYGNGKNYIVSGAVQTAGMAYGHHFTQGGELRVLAGSGNAGTGSPIGGVSCEITPDQGVISSPAVGAFLADRDIGIVVGTSDVFKGASDTDKLIAINPHCQQQWRASLDGLTTDSPALVDGLGNGHLQIAEGTATGDNHGTVYLLDGANGRPDWVHDVSGEVIGGITSADLGAGYQDLLVPTTSGLYILNGKTGEQLAYLGKGIVLQSSPLVTDDADGQIGITIAGFNRSGGVITHYQITGSSGDRDNEAGAWPMFHHDPQLTGSTLRRLS